MDLDKSCFCEIHAWEVLEWLVNMGPCESGLGIMPGALEREKP